MKRNHVVTLATLALIVCMASPALAGKKDTFATWGADPEKAYKKVWFGPVPAELKQLGEIGFPKKVGLLSYYLMDTGSLEFSALAATYGGTYQKTFGLNERGANKFASAFAEVGVPVLKEEFAARGMELLTPVEFLNPRFTY